MISPLFKPLAARPSVRPTVVRFGSDAKKAKPPESQNAIPESGLDLGRLRTALSKVLKQTLAEHQPAPGLTSDSLLASFERLLKEALAGEEKPEPVIVTKPIEFIGSKNLADYPYVRAVNNDPQIPEQLRGTPFEKLLKYQNLGAAIETETFERPELQAIMCMDHRKKVKMPEKFAYVIRNAGANGHVNEFSMAYAIAVGGVSHVAIITHTDCGMVNLANKREQFIKGMAERAGWSEHHAESFFHSHTSDFGIPDPVLSAIMESQRLQAAYPKIQVQPFIYNVEDGKLYVIDASLNGAGKPKK